jgi:hypothetical protein
LDALVFSIQYGQRNSRMNATLVIRSTQGPFRMFAQDRINQDFDESLTLDRNDSVAGKVAGEQPGVVVYVPNTRFIHGVRIDLLKQFPTREYFRATKMVEGALQWLGAANQAKVRSLICIRVPLVIPGVEVVLCVSSPEANSIGYLELSAIKVSSSVIAQILKTPGALPIE